MVKTWSSSTKATSRDWLQLISVVLENGPQLLWNCYWREEAKFLEQQGKQKDLRLPKIKFLVRVITLILRKRLTVTDAPCPYAAQQL